MAKSQLHALLIAINNYHPTSNVTALAGCINDRDAVKKFLKKNYSDLNLQITTLTDAEATRTNVIATFRNEIVKKAKKGDTVILYYAGHGSYSTSAPDFAKFDGLGQDETFVCYDSRLPNNHDLTDKELAVLLAEVRKEVHLVVIADACHSASVTRTVGFQRKPEIIGSSDFRLAKKRFQQPRIVTRNIESYLLSEDNYYTKLAGKIAIPRSKHLLMSACSREEEAWETTNRRGLFTTYLLKVLEQNSNISYADLFAQVRALVFNTAKNQQPTLYPFEGFNPNTVFLRQGVKPNNNRHLIELTDLGDWKMELGAINGVPTRDIDKAKIVIGVYEGLGDKAIFKGATGVSDIGITHMTLKEELNLLNDRNYWGELQTIPTALVVNLKGRKKNVAAFLALYKEQPSIYANIVQKVKSAKYTIYVSKDKLKLKFTETGEVIDMIPNMDEVTITQLNKQLEHIADWENIATLENKETSISDSIEVKFLREQSRGKFDTHTEETITLDYYEKGADRTSRGQAKPIWYQIQVRNTSNKNLYISLLHLSAKFGVTSHFATGMIPANSEWKTLDDQHGLVIPNKEDGQIKDIFKIIASTRHFDDHKFIQDELKATPRSTVSREEYEEAPQDDWFTRTIQVMTIRPQGNVGKQALNINGLTFEKHDAFEAELSFAPMMGTSRSLNSTNNLADFFDKKEATVINVGQGKTRSIQQDHCIIELTDIKNAASLNKNPLTINVHSDLTGGDDILPVTMKDGFIIPIGKSTLMEDGNTQITIDHLPEKVDLPPGAQRKRGLGRALWFSLLKLAGLKEEAFRLRRVSYRKGMASHGKLHQRTVTRAKNILLVIHGIIGDTKGMIANLEFLKEKGYYDLILTYDYENLNTKIEDIAANLNEQLEAYGLGPDDGKNFDILAHSMGGLVSRYLIEFIRKGDTLVDHLFLFGTPNGGSIFGELPIYRDKLVKLMTVGLNFGKAWLGGVGVVLGVLNKILIGSKPITITLKQMSSNSEFIDKLKDGQKGHTKYWIIAGDISDYENIKGMRLKRLVESVLVKIGNKANANEPNDIAVLVEDIRSVPDVIAAENYDVCCHHLNYFEDGDGLVILEEIMKRK